MADDKFYFLLDLFAWFAQRGHGQSCLSPTSRYCTIQYQHQHRGSPPHVETVTLTRLCRMPRVEKSSCRNQCCVLVSMCSSYPLAESTVLDVVSSGTTPTVSVRRLVLSKGYIRYKPRARLKSLESNIGRENADVVVVVARASTKSRTDRPTSAIASRLAVALHALPQKGQPPSLTV
jgi:hypothetical protein